MKQKSGPGKAPAEQVVKDIRRQTRRHARAGACPIGGRSAVLPVRPGHQPVSVVRGRCSLSASSLGDRSYRNDRRQGCSLLFEAAARRNPALMALAVDLAIPPLSLFAFVLGGALGVSSLALLAAGSSIALALSGWSVAAFTAADAWPGPAPAQRDRGRDTLCREKIADLSEYLVQMFGIRVEQR